MLDTNLISQLVEIQTNVNFDGSVYQPSCENMPCGNGPTNCQNQW